MITISTQLRRYFLLLSLFSIGFITISANVSINLFFSNYLKGVRDRDDQKVVQYIEQLYSGDTRLNSQSLMSILHYTSSEDIVVRIIDTGGDIIWDSSNHSMHGRHSRHSVMTEDLLTEKDITYKNYPFHSENSPIGSIDIGRPKSIISSIENRQFINTINGVFLAAFLLTIIIAIITSTKISKKFLNPIYEIKENAKLIEHGKYKEINKVKTNTHELNDLSLSINELAIKLHEQEILRKRMTTDISHELRTPIATIQSYIEAFIDGVWKPDNEKLSTIHGEIKRLTNLIKDLSDLSIIERDEIILDKVKVNLSKILLSTIESFSLMLMSKKIILEKKIQNDVEFYGDEALLQRIFANILSNAYKYTNECGKIKISLVKRNDAIRITIEDSGIGIPNNEIKYIFERFYRSDFSRNRETGGTGIGLTITKVLVEAHGGGIRIESEEGVGTKAIIEF